MSRSLERIRWIERINSTELFYTPHKNIPNPNCSVHSSLGYIDRLITTYHADNRSSRYKHPQHEVPRMSFCKNASTAVPRPRLHCSYQARWANDLVCSPARFSSKSYKHFTSDRSQYDHDALSILQADMMRTTVHTDLLLSYTNGEHRGPFNYILVARPCLWWVLSHAIGGPRFAKKKNV